MTADRRCIEVHGGYRAYLNMETGLFELDHPNGSSVAVFESLKKLRYAVETDTHYIQTRALQETLDYFDKDHQLRKLIEECSELISAICHDDTMNIMEEIADVRVVLDQMNLIYNPDTIEKIRVSKVKRLYNWIQNLKKEDAK